MAAVPNASEGWYFMLVHQLGHVDYM
jgi:hypothetical protein